MSLPKIHKHFLSFHAVGESGEEGEEGLRLEKYWVIVKKNASPGPGKKASGWRWAGKKHNHASACLLQGTLGPSSPFKNCNALLCTISGVGRAASPRRPARHSFRVSPEKKSHIGFGLELESLPSLRTGILLTLLYLLMCFSHPTLYHLGLTTTLNFAYMNSLDFPYIDLSQMYVFKKMYSFSGHFPGCSVVKTLCLHCRGHEFNPWSGNWDSECQEERPHSPIKSSITTAKENYQLTGVGRRPEIWECIWILRWLKPPQREEIIQPPLIIQI